MTQQVNKQGGLPGYEKDGIITINYLMNNSVKDGKKYAGTHRTAYLPNNDEGK